MALILTLINLRTSALAAPATQLKPEAPHKLEELLKKYDVKLEDVSYSVVDLETKDVTEQLFATRPEVPASLMKVPTCLYALTSLGGHYRFSTQLLARGQIEEGVLKGDLILRGEGDPYLTSSRLFDLNLKLKQLGIKKVEGPFYYDGSGLPQQAMISELGQGDQSYNPGLAGLNLEFNRVRVQATPPGSSAFHAQFKTIPLLKYFTLEKVKTPFAPKQKFRWKELGETQEAWQVSTKERYNELEVIPVRRPALYTAQMFHLYAQRLGLELKDPTPDPVSDSTSESQILAETLSPPVLQICAMALEYSNNLFAETLLLKSAQAQKPDIENLEQAGEVMLEWFKKTYPKIDWEGTVFENGSGLSLNSRISAQTLTDLLVHEKDRRDLNRNFWSLLSISGQTGWLKNRLMEDDVSHRIFAKTGSLDFAHNITGYFLSQNNKSYAFTLMISDIEKRMRAEKLKKNQSSYQLLYRQARTYRHRALKLADELMTHWIQKL